VAVPSLGRVSSAWLCRSSGHIVAEQQAESSAQEHAPLPKTPPDGHRDTQSALSHPSASRELPCLYPGWALQTTCLAASDIAERRTRTLHIYTRSVATQGVLKAQDESAGSAVRQLLAIQTLLDGRCLSCRPDRTIWKASAASERPFTA
jgi:hypothetical protein